MTELAAPPPPPPAAPVDRFDFGRPFAYVFEDPQWVQKILLGALFMLASIVVIGAFIVYGYVARLVRNVIAGEPRPLPDWTDLGDYIGEGIQLFAVTFIYAIPALVLMGLTVPFNLLGATGNDAAQLVGGLASAGFSCLMLPVGLATGIWVPAALLRAVVERRFGAAFEFAEIWNFIRANLANYALAYVVWLVARFAAGVGIIICCVGVFATSFWSACVGAFAFAEAVRLSRKR